MELKQQRDVRTDTTTIGLFFVNGEQFCYGLEPKDRGLTIDTPIEQIESIKVAGQTAVPAGRYQIVKFYSEAHKCMLPRVVNIPGFDFIEIHAGNFARDTKGCLLLGTHMSVDSVLGSREAIDLFYDKFFEAVNKGEEVFITYE